MSVLFTIIVAFFAGMGAGLGTGFAGMSAAAVIMVVNQCAVAWICALLVRFAAVMIF